MPVGAFGGRKEIMQHISPLGNVYQAGTLSGNPIAMIAGYVMLKTLKENPSIYKQLDETTDYLRDGLNDVLNASGTPYVINQLGSMISVHFSEHAITNFSSAAAANNELFKKFFHAMLKRGVYLPPSAFETWFLCSALTKEDVDTTIQATKESLKEIL
jgi:glutamate-1-semialdehyde 2,1-aminomutase